MKRIYISLLALLCCVCLLEAGCKEVMAEEKKKTVDVMFLHDTHSHLNEFATVEEDKSQLMGGFSKIKTLIRAQQEKNPETLLLDGGDFSMGTLIQVMFEEEASELRMLGELGMDVTTFGNHEFDYNASGLANMLTRAVETGDTLPSLVVCNVDWNAMEEKGLTEDQQLLKDAFEKADVKKYKIFNKNGVRIAVIGVFGKDSLDCAPNCPLEFADPVESVKQVVEEIKNADLKVDMIACVSHSGTDANEKKSEDEILAKSVPELDLILSGHTHTKLEEPIVHGDTHIVSAGEYGKYLGNLSMTQKEDGRWNLDSYELITIDDSIQKDQETQEKVDALMDKVDEKYLNQFGYQKDQVLCYNEVEFVPQDDLGEKHTELNLGSIIADAYTYGAEQVLGAGKVDVTVAPAGTIRDSYPLGDITVEDVYNSFSLGMGKDGIPGYALIEAYLTGEELKTVAEIDSSVSDFMTIARLYTDGLYWSYNPNRMLLNKTTDVYLSRPDGTREELEDDKLYCVVTDYYTSQMLGNVTKLSKGLISIVPKFADGTPMEDYADAIIMQSEDRELKAWTAIADYMSAFSDVDGDGTPDVPEKYSQNEGRKVVEDSKNIIDLVKNPNKFFFLICGAAVLIIVVLIGFIAGIVKVFRKRYRKNAGDNFDRKDCF